VKFPEGEAKVFKGINEISFKGKNTANAVEESKE
jgi:hypothetical protein